MSWSRGIAFFKEASSSFSFVFVCHTSFCRGSLWRRRWSRRLRRRWAKGRWWLGKRDEMGKNRGWLKVKTEDYTPPKSGWIVYVTKEKEWKEATELSCTPAERIVLGLGCERES